MSTGRWSEPNNVFVTHVVTAGEAASGVAVVAAVTANHGRFRISMLVGQDETMPTRVRPYWINPNISGGAGAYVNFPDGVSTSLIGDMQGFLGSPYQEVYPVKEIGCAFFGVAANEILHVAATVQEWLP